MKLYEIGYGKSWEGEHGEIEQREGLTTIGRKIAERAIDDRNF